jgi:hypothetical protein
MVRVLAVCRRRHDDLLRRRRRRAGTGPGRRQVHRARVEEQSHRGRAEQERDQRHCHPPSDYPGSARCTAFVGRHRPLPVPESAFPDLSPGIQETRSDINPGAEARFAVSGESLATAGEPCGGPDEARHCPGETSASGHPRLARSRASPALVRDGDGSPRFRSCPKADRSHRPPPPVDPRRPPTPPLRSAPAAASRPC